MQIPKEIVLVICNYLNVDTDIDSFIHCCGYLHTLANDEFWHQRCKQWNVQKQASNMSWKNTFLQYQALHRFKMPKQKAKFLLGTNWQNAFENVEQEISIKVISLGNEGCGKTQVWKDEYEHSGNFVRWYGACHNYSSSTTCNMNRWTSHFVSYGEMGTNSLY